MLDDAEVIDYHTFPKFVQGWDFFPTIEKKAIRGCNAPYKHTNWWIKP